MKMHTMFKFLICCFVGSVMAEDATTDNAMDGHVDHAPQAQHWTKHPVIEENRFSSRKRAVFEVKNLNAESAKIFPPVGEGQFPEKFAIQGDGHAYLEPLKKRRFAISPNGRGNYYWAMVQSKTPQEVITANTVKYFTAPGPAPTAMLAETKSRLQLTPAPLPREHWRYREGETWQFKLSFDGKALPNELVLMETAQGTQHVFESDKNGMVSVTFPEDIDREKPEQAKGHHHRPKSQFVLIATHTDAGVAYQTTFNYQYGLSAMEGKSLAAGLGFMVFGGLLATPLLRRPKDKKKGGHHA